MNKVDIEEATRLVKEQGKFCYLSIMRRLGLPYWKARELKNHLQNEGMIDDKLVTVA